MGFINKRMIADDGLNHWHTVDDDRNIVLRAIRSRPGKISRGGAWMFELQWQNEVIKFTLDHRYESAGNGNLNYFWEFMKIDIPESIKPHTEELMQIIQEAMNAWGYLSKNEGIENVYIDFSTFDQSIHQSVQ